MYATIEVSPYIHVQGPIARMLPGGRAVILQNGREYVGSLADRLAPRLQAVAS